MVDLSHVSAWALAMPQYQQMSLSSFASITNLTLSMTGDYDAETLAAFMQPLPGILTGLTTLAVQVYKIGNTILYTF